MVSSTGQAEGKTTLSSNLAISIAKKHYKTIIVDCDLRNPTVKHQLEIKSDCKTITDVLEGKCSAGDAIIRVPHTSLYALLAKGFNENASEIISSDSMRVLLEALKKTFDYVIIDVPPVGLVSDAVAMQDMVDGLIYVVRHDYIKVKRIQDALESFSGSNIVMLGCVYNMSKGALANFRYGYNRYGYGYGSSYGNYGSDGYYGSDFDYKSIDKIMQKELDSIDEPESKKREEKQK